MLSSARISQPWYRETGEASERGEGAGAGKTINCPLPADSDGSRVIGHFATGFCRCLRDFRSDIVLLSAGFDSRINDPLGEFRRTDRDFRELTRIMTDIAADYCHHRLVSVLEGGYNLAVCQEPAKRTCAVSPEISTKGCACACRHTRDRGTLCAHHAIAEVAVVGVADSLKGQVPLAFAVVRDPSCIATAEPLRRQRGCCDRRIQARLRSRH